MFGIAKDTDEKLHLKVSDFATGTHKRILKTGVSYKFGSNMNPESRGHDEARDRDAISDLLQYATSAGEGWTGNIHATVHIHHHAE
jgi:hypothetical protein